MKNHIYADHAATTPLMPEALDAMLPFLKEDFGNPSSLHGWAKSVRKTVEDARATIAKCINAEPEEIFFTSGGTEADNWVIKGASGGLMVSSYEHHAVLNAAASEVRKGREVVYVRLKVGNGGGYVMPEKLSKAWKGCIGLVSVMLANNEIGTINPVHLLSEFAHNVLYSVMEMGVARQREGDRLSLSCSSPLPPLDPGQQFWLGTVA